MSNKKHTGLTRRAPSLMALEQRFMFDGAAIDSLHDTLTDTTPLDTAVVADVFKFDASAASLASTAQAAQQQVRDYLARATDAQLFSLFNGGKTAPDADWIERLSSLREALSNGSFHVNVVAMDGASQFTAVAAFTENGPNGEPTIFINTYWFGMFDAPDATRALVEELGHVFDAYLNPNADSQGDEGEAFADTVIDGALRAELGASLLTQSDQGTVTVNGLTYEVEFASLNFSNAYHMVYDWDTQNNIENTTERWASKEQNLHYFNTVSLGVVNISDGSNGTNFSGNDVSAVAVNVGGSTYYGWISRPIKSNGVVRGFYFWTDNSFTTLALAQADGNMDGDSSVADNRGFVLVVDQAWFDQQISDTDFTKTFSSTSKDVINGYVTSGATLTVASVGSSSDRVDAALNSVMPPNSAPAAANDSLTVNEDSGTTTVSASSGLLSNDTDVNNDTLTITGYTISGVSGTQTLGSAVTITGVGSITINSNGSYSFTPVANYSGSVPPITYTVSDGNGGTATAVLSITVTPVNDAPDAVNDTATITEDTPASGNLLGNDTDPDGDPLTVTSFSIAGQSGTFTLGTPYVISGVGTLTVNANGTYSFVPASNYTGAVPVVTYTISDGHGGTDTATLSMTMAPSANEAPVANPDNADGALSAQAPGCASGTAVTETQQTGNVLTNDTDPDITLVAGTTHQVTAVTSGTGNTWNGTTITGKYGVLTIGANGAYSYNIDENNADVKALASGATLSETFNYTVSEIGNSPNLTSSSTLRIVINGANNAPVALDDYNSVLERSSSTTNMVNGSSTSTYGTATGDVTTNDTDTDSVSKTVTNLASETIYNYSTDFGSSTNSIKSYLNPTYVTKVEYATAAAPTVWNTLLNANGTNCSVSGYDASSGFKIFLTNQTALSGYATGGTVRITLSGAGNKDGTYTGSYSGYTTTAGTSTAISSGSNVWLAGKYGSVNLSSTGTYTYYLTSTALAADESYEEQFTYSVTDGSCTATAVLHIAVNGATTLTMDNEAVTTAEDTTYRSDATSNLLTGDTGFTAGGSGTTATPYVSNFSWGGSTITVGTTADHSASGTKTIAGIGTLTVNGDGSYEFAPASNYSGPVPTAIYTTTDGTNVAQATLSITITSVNDSSVLAADSKTIPEDGSGSGNVLDNDTDSDNSLSVASFTWNNGTGTVGTATDITSGGVTVGSLTLGSNGFYTFTPAANWNGTVPTISYTTNTGSTSTLDITVTPINDPPTLDLDASGSGTGWNTSYTNQGSAVSIGDTDVAIADVDDTNIETATVILTNPQTGDALNFDASVLFSSYGITATSSASNGVITVTLTGTSTLANYQAAIQAITFSSTGTSTIDRVVSVKVNDGVADSNTAYTAIDVNPDARTLTVTGTTVNEASPYVQFQVGGASEQWVTLAIGTTGSGSGHATMGTDFLPNLQYFNGTSWVDYTGGFVQIPSGTTTLLVRTPVLQDIPYEGAETLKLTAYNQSQWSLSTGTSGNSTIVDDGTGSIFLAGNNTSTPSTSGTSGYPSYLDDDRPVTVDNIVVNEASPWAMFTVSGYANQVLSLALLNGTATVGDGNPADGSEDYSPDLEYWNGSAWTAYNGTSVTMAGSTLLVRTAVHQDSLFEGQHVFNLGVTKLSSNTTVYGAASIYDDGTGKIFAFDNINDGIPTITTGPGAGFDDDRTLIINSPLVNEASDYVVFTLNGNSGQTVSLQLVDDSNNGSVAGKANILENQTLKIWDGVAWVDYDPNNLPTFDGNGKIFVRVDIQAEQDAPFEGAETFKLNATLTGTSNAVTGVATIIDDGTGVKYPGTFTSGAPTTSSTGLDNDQFGTITVTGGNYNENSPRAVFTVNATSGQLLTLDVQNAAETGKAPTGDNEGKPNDSLDTADIYYSLDGGATWQLYTGPVTAGSVPVLVAVDITNERDNVYEGEEQLKLVVTSGGQSASGYSSIFDDGTGAVTQAITQSTTNNTGANDPSVVKDDDRPKAALPPQLPPAAPAPLNVVEPAPVLPARQLAAAFSSELAPIAPALKPIEPPLPLEANLTSAGGPQFVASESAPPGLSLFAGVTDQFIQTTDAATKISLPYDAFIHSSKDAVIKLQAKQADDSPLPKWVEFDPAAGTFTVKPPKDFKGKLDLKVIARDDEGREAVAIFQMFVGEQDQNTTKPQSRSSFTEKLRMAGKRPVSLVRVAEGAHKVRVG
jgi:VCBS repeat-containing protein/CshA-type fibril repeat protein